MKAPHGLCAKLGCTKAATHAIRINVPNEGSAIGANDSLGLIIALKLCHGCASDAAPPAFFANESGAALRDLFAVGARGRPEFVPDFDSAWITPVALSSGEWQEFARLNLEQRIRGRA